MSATLPHEGFFERLSLAVDYQNRYSCELVTYFIHFRVPEQPKAVLQFTIPKVMEIETYKFPPGISSDLPSMAETAQEKIILIPLGEGFNEGEFYEIQIKARIHTFSMDQYLVAEASLVINSEKVLATETLQIAVYGKGKYLKYLPELYDSDDFTSRFLMLFESFWKPVNQQIDQVEYYFDPDLTPPEFVPWLASWLGLQVDPNLPLERVRTLLKNAMMLYQYRGTYRALKKYLEIYTEGKVEITEQRAKNFALGKNSTLGVDIALGSKNRPGSLIINLHTSEKELERMKFSDEMYQRKMKEVIRTMIPAHTNINLNCIFYT